MCCCWAWADRACVRKCCALSFGDNAGFPDLHVLDSTDPAQVAATEKKIDVARTLFIVSSKSGSTLEPNIFKQYFYERAGRDGKPFCGDHGSRDRRCKRWRSRMVSGHIFFGLPSIGGRYSALSDFGMIPAAAMGIDVGRLLDCGRMPWRRRARRRRTIRE